MYGRDYKDIDEKLVNELKQHHKETQTVDAKGKQIRGGHRYFKVFFTDGGEGEIEAGSYCVTFEETKIGVKLGKER